MMPAPHRVAVALVALAATPGGQSEQGGGCALTAQGGVPVNPQLFGYNLEVFGTMTNNSMSDTGGMAVAASHSDYGRGGQNPCFASYVRISSLPCIQLPPNFARTRPLPPCPDPTVAPVET